MSPKACATTWPPAATWGVKLPCSALVIGIGVAVPEPPSVESSLQGLRQRGLGGRGWSLLSS
eukprot:7859150-Alexandrium_andersonii.AAC.1